MTVTPDPADANPEPPAGADAPEKPEKSGKARSALREGVILVGTAVLLYYVMLTFVARLYLIPSESM